jgi:hypothetical protein
MQQKSGTNHRTNLVQRPVAARELGARAAGRLAGIIAIHFQLIEFNR